MIEKYHRSEFLMLIQMVSMMLFIRDQPSVPKEMQRLSGSDQIRDTVLQKAVYGMGLL